MVRKLELTIKEFDFFGTKGLGLESLVERQDLYFKKIKYGGGSGSCNHTSNKFDYLEF